MNRLTKWIESLYAPEKTNFNQDVTLEEVMQALADPTVRKYWIQAIIEELRNINVRFDRMMDAKIAAKFEEDMYRRKGILFALNQILDSKHMIESEREDQERQNRIFAQYQGAAAPVTFDNRATNPARD
jgi:hypothetical protein